jgi:hypothetical protein
LLLGSHLRDFVLDGVEQSDLLGELGLDRLLLRRPFRNDPRLVRTRLLETCASRFDLLAIPLDRPKNLRVLTGDPLDRIEPRDDVVETARAEDHLERRITLTVDVQIAQPPGDPVLGDDEALAGGDEVFRVRGKVDVYPVEFDIRVVPGLDRLLEIRIEPLDLSHDGHRLCPFVLDRLSRSRSHGKQQPGGESREQNGYRRPSGVRAHEASSALVPNRAAGGGLARHKSETLAALPDACNR